MNRAEIESDLAPVLERQRQALSGAHHFTPNKTKLTRDEVIAFIDHASDGDMLQILDACVDRVATTLGCATGIEDDKHRLLRQIEANEV